MFSCIIFVHLAPTSISFNLSHGRLTDLSTVTKKKTVGIQGYKLKTQWREYFYSVCWSLAVFMKEDRGAHGIKYILSKHCSLVDTPPLLVTRGWELEDLSLSGGICVLVFNILLLAITNKIKWNLYMCLLKLMSVIFCIL